MTARDLPDMRAAWAILGQVTGWPERAGRLASSALPPQQHRHLPARPAPGALRGRTE